MVTIKSHSKIDKTKQPAVIKIGWALDRVPDESDVLGSVQHRNQLGSLQYTC